jgi:hypothetical protein
LGRNEYPGPLSLIEINDLCILVKNQWQTPKSETWKRKGEIINNASRKIPYAAKQGDSL